MKHAQLSILLFILSINALGQHTFIPKDEDYYHLLDRYTLLNTSQHTFPTSVKPYFRTRAGALALSLLEGEGTRINETSLFNRNFLIQDNWEILHVYNLEAPKTERSKFPNFYQYRGSFFSVDVPDFKLVVNPVLAFDMGYDTKAQQQVFRNTRGAELRGSIADKVGFYSFLSENQFRFPAFYNQWVQQNKVVPGAGFVKDFGSNARDFFVARGYITASPLEHIQVQFGHDRNFIGNGYRSLIMSDFAKENLFLKLVTNVWRISYLNLFSEYTDYHSRATNGGVEKKYGAFHYLNFQILPGKLDVGLFEHIIFQHQNKGYEAQYLNPIIFYRAVEHGLNSADNALLGLDWRYNPVRGTSFYGQFVLDEFHKNELFGRTGSWVNKWAFQMGGKWINAFGISNLDVQAEYNAVRPYTYTHNAVGQNYAHYNQAIAHPLGANFKEVLGVVRYQFKPRLNLVLKAFHITQGMDSSSVDPTTHFGGDLLKDYESRPKDIGIKIGDGVKVNTNLLDLTLSYQFYHRTLVEFRCVYRKSESDLPSFNASAMLLYLGLRMNIDRMAFDF